MIYHVGKYFCVSLIMYVHTDINLTLIILSIYILIKLHFQFGIPSHNFSPHAIVEIASFRMVPPVSTSFHSSVSWVAQVMRWWTKSFPKMAKANRECTIDLRSHL